MQGAYPWEFFASQLCEGLHLNIIEILRITSQMSNIKDTHSTMTTTTMLLS